MTSEMVSIPPDPNATDDITDHGVITASTAPILPAGLVAVYVNPKPIPPKPKKRCWLSHSDAITMIIMLVVIFGISGWLAWLILTHEPNT